MGLLYGYMSRAPSGEIGELVWLPQDTFATRWYAGHETTPALINHVVAWEAGAGRTPGKVP